MKKSFWEFVGYGLFILSIYGAIALCFGILSLAL